MKKIVFMVLTVSICCIGQISMGAYYTIGSRNSTGVNVPVIAGKWMTIEASGSVQSNWTHPSVGPEGNRNLDPYIRNNYLMALVGLHNSDLIYIGPLFIKQFQKSGTIALLCNDNHYDDNVGSFHVVVNYYDNFVKGRLKPATMGAFKTSHFEERKVCHTPSVSSTMTGFQERCYGEPTQDGYCKCNIDIKGTWLVS